MKNIKILKMITGQNVIGEIVIKEQTPQEVVLISKPCEIVINEMTGAAALRPWTLGVENVMDDSPIGVNGLAVVCITTAPSDIINAYNELMQRITSGLTTATPEEKKLILG